MKIINVNSNDVLLDDEDYLYITSCYNLHIDNNGYVACRPKYKRMGLFSMTLHKMLMNPERKGRNVVVDHIDGDKLNNQKSNLRVCTHRENMRNRSPHKNSRSIYKGVSWNIQKKAWQVFINSEENRTKNIGAFTNEIAAANCYNHWAINEFGEYAKLNDCPTMNYDEWNQYRLSKNKTSSYRGVSLVEGKWLSQIYYNKKNIKIGKYDTERDAANAYNEMAFELKGEKANLNIIKGR